MGHDKTHPSGKAYRVVAFTFDGVGTAKEAFQDAKTGGALDGFKVITEAIIERDASGEVKVHESGRGGLGATVGAVGGGVLSLLSGPIGLFWMLVGGGVAGGLIGHFAGRAIPVDDLRKMGDALPNDSSGIYLLLEDKESEKAIEALQGLRADVLTVDLGDELSGVISETVVADVELDDADSDADPGGSEAGDGGTPPSESASPA